MLAAWERLDTLLTIAGEEIRRLPKTGRCRCLCGGLAICRARLPSGGTGGGLAFGVQRGEQTMGAGQGERVDEVQAPLPQWALGFGDKARRTIETRSSGGPRCLDVTLFRCCQLGECVRRRRWRRPEGFLCARGERSDRCSEFVEKAELSANARIRSVACSLARLKTYRRACEALVRVSSSESLNRSTRKTDRSGCWERTAAAPRRAEGAQRMRSAGDVRKRPAVQVGNGPGLTCEFRRNALTSSARFRCGAKRSGDWSRAWVRRRWVVVALWMAAFG